MRNIVSIDVIIFSTLILIFSSKIMQFNKF